MCDDGDRTDNTVGKRDRPDRGVDRPLSGKVSNWGELNEQSNRSLKKVHAELDRLEARVLAGYDKKKSD